MMNGKADRVLNPNGKINANLTKQGGGKLQREHPDIWSEVWDLSGHLEFLYRSGKAKQIPLVERVRWWISGEVNSCRSCDAPIEDHAIYCGKKCSANDPDVLEKRKSTRRENMNGKWMPDTWVPTGWASPEGHQLALEKRRENNGGQHWTQEMTEKARRTKLDNWGDENIQIKRAQETIQRDYGVSNPAHVPGASEKISEARRGKQSLNPNLNQDPRVYDDSWLYEQLKKHGREAVKEWFQCSDNFIAVREVQCGFRQLNITGAETEIEMFLRDNGMTPMMRTRKIIPSRELDAYLPEYNLAIEYDGIYWHSASTYAIAKQQYETMVEKELKCNKAGIQLLRIPETDWKDQNKQKIWKSLILSKTNQNGFDRIGARECVVGKVDKKQARDFMNENHLQGSTGCSFAVGLWYKEELVSCCTIGKPRYDRDADLELIRFATKKNTVVRGGYSRLIKHSLEKGQKLISYANKSWSKGNVYEHAGFTREGETKFNYYWYRGINETLTRNSSQKKKLAHVLGNDYDFTKTENENMFANGWRKVIIPGNIKYSISSQ